jgi:outer membrane lipoprotein-sorting protein
MLCALVRCAARADDAPPQGIDEKLWKEMLAINARGTKLVDLRAEFIQEKFTPLLKKPLVSTGKILIKGSATLWITEKPEPTVLRIDAKEIRLLYPAQKVLEIYKTDEKMESLAASPFPRLEILKQHFSFEKIPVQELSKEADESKHIAFRMKPLHDELRKHIDRVSVLIERATGLVLKAQTIDADGDRLVLSFVNVRANPGLTDADLEMKVPADVKVTHPLEGGSAGDAPSGQGQRK